MTVLNQLHEITFSKAPKHPIIFLHIPKNSSSLKDIIFELSDIEITIFEEFLAHTW